jgi:hypothetical protein
MKIGVISDTHGLLRPEALAALAGSDLVVHAGDVGSPEVLCGLEAVAPVVAVRGNIDRGPWAAKLAERETVRAGGWLLHVLHDLRELDCDPAAEGWAAVIAGHSHQPCIETRGGVLFVNPGSAGPRRFRLPVAVATLAVGQGGISAQLIFLEVAPPKESRGRVSRTGNSRTTARDSRKVESSAAKARSE